MWGFPLLGTIVMIGQAWTKATEFDYRVQEDARQHVFWMLRYLDAAAFPDDPVADYFQSVAPWLYRGLYFCAWSLLGIEPRHLVLILPPLLGLLAVVCSIFVVRRLSPHPLAAGLAGLLCAQTLWMEDDLVSATPRAFATPLLLLFLLFVLRRSAWGCGLAIAAQAGVYPPAALMAWVTTCLRLGDRRNRRVWLVSSVALCLGLLPLLLFSNPFGPSITREAAQSMVEFQAVGDIYGRAFFFHENPLIFWGFGVRSGLLFWGLMNPLNLVVLAWPWLRPGRTPRSQAILERTYAERGLLGQFALSVLMCFVLAHLALFQLHFPARYPYHGFRTLLPLAAGILLAEGIHWQLRRWHSHRRWHHRIANLALASFQVTLLLLPFFPELSVDNQLYTTSRAENLYEFLQGTPSDTLVATADKEGSNVPFYAGRSTLLGKEYALPYHPEYYDIFRQRTRDFLAAYAATDPAPLLAFLNRYPVTYFLLRADGFTPDYLQDKDWLYPFQPERDQAIAQLAQLQETGDRPLLLQFPACTVLQDRNLSLVDAACLRTSLTSAN